MSQYVDVFETWFQICLLTAGACTTLFVLLWVKTPWYRTSVSRLIMFRSAAIAAVLDLTAYYKFWASPEFEAFYYVSMAVNFGIISVVSLILTYMVLRLNYFRQKEGRQDE